MVVKTQGVGGRGQEEVCSHPSEVAASCSHASLRARCARPDILRQVRNRTIVKSPNF